MKYDNHIYTQAENVVMARRIKKERELEKRIDVAYNMDLNFEKLRKSQDKLGIEIVKSILKKGNVKSKILELEIESNKIIDNIKGLLSKYGLKESYFEVGYECNKCKDKGYVDDRVCDCLRRVLLSCYIKDINKDISLNNKTFDTFGLKKFDNLDHDEKSKMIKNFDICKNYSREFTYNSKPLFMIGRSGKGKTHLTFSIANYLLDNGYNVVIYKAFDLKNKIDSLRFNLEEYNTLIDICKHCDLLIIDDFSLDSVNEFFKDNVYNLISTRIEKEKPFIINTTDAVQKIFNKYGESFFNKIKGNSILLDFR